MLEQLGRHLEKHDITSYKVTYSYYTSSKKKNRTEFLYYQNAWQNFQTIKQNVEVINSD